MKLFSYDVFVENSRKFVSFANKPNLQKGLNSSGCIEKQSHNKPCISKDYHQIPSVSSALSCFFFCLKRQQKSFNIDWGVIYLNVIIPNPKSTQESRKGVLGSDRKSLLKIFLSFHIITTCQAQEHTVWGSESLHLLSDSQSFTSRHIEYYMHPSAREQPISF